MRKLLISICVMCFSLWALAAEECASWGCMSTISTLYTNTNGSIYVGTPLDEKLANCTAVSGIYFTLNPTSGNAKEIYSTLLAAYMSGEKIQLRVIDGHPECQLAYVRLDKSF